MRFDLVDLRLFLLVAESGSITLGAERAGLALASASERIKGMEDRLGVALLERRRRGVTLTSAGRALIGHAQSVQNQIAQMTGDMRAYARGLRARIRLLANTAASAELLPDVLGAFLAKHENIDVDLVERPSFAIVEAIANGAADLGIAASWAMPGAVEWRPFRTDRLVVIASRGQRNFAKQRSVSLDDIAGEPFVGLGPGNPLQEHIVRQAARRGRHLAFRVRLTTLDAVCGFVGRGIGVAVVPEAAARRHRAGARLRILALKDDLATRELMICAKSFSALPPHAKLLAEALAP
jgi:molybdate transport repressor ModE-like protein